MLKKIRSIPLGYLVRYQNDISMDSPEKAFAIVEQESDTAIASQRFHKHWKDATASMSADEQRALEMTSDVADAKISQVLNPWLGYFLQYDPRPILEKGKCSVLAIGAKKIYRYPLRKI